MLQTITPKQLADLRTGGRKIHLIDVRTPVEFREVARRLRSTTSRSTDSIRERCSPNGAEHRTNRSTSSAAREAAASRPVRSSFRPGSRTSSTSKGERWPAKQPDLPIVRGKKAISLERQVRIAAGLLVVTGAALGYWVDPLWIAPLRLRRSGIGVRGRDRHLRHGDAAGPHAVEPSEGRSVVQCRTEQHLLLALISRTAGRRTCRPAPLRRSGATCTTGRRTCRPASLRRSGATCTTGRRTCRPAPLRRSGATLTTGIRSHATQTVLPRVPFACVVSDPG